MEKLHLVQYSKVRIEELNSWFQEVSMKGSLKSFCEAPITLTLALHFTPVREGGNLINFNFFVVHLFQSVLLTD